MTDPYLEPNGVLRNRLGITDADLLDQAQYEQVYLRQLKLADRPIGGDFDLEHLNEIHRHLFADVFDWAGVPRKDFTSIKMGERPALFCGVGSNTEIVPRSSSPISPTTTIYADYHAASSPNGCRITGTKSTWCIRTATATAEKPAYF